VGRIGLVVRQQVVQAVLRCLDGGDVDAELAETRRADCDEQRGRCFSAGAKIPQAAVTRSPPGIVLQSDI
jgi:hypothetical protein